MTCNQKNVEPSDEKFQTLFNGITDAVFVYPFAGNGRAHFVEVNSAACSQYGYTKEEFSALGMEDIQVRCGVKTAESELKKTLREKGRAVYETHHRKKNGERFPVEISCTLFDFHGEVVVLSTARDITDRKQKEKEREEALKFASEQAKYALVGQVAGKMAHDFNNILGAIMGNAEVALMDCQENETIQSLNIILQQTLRGKSLTQNLMAFAKDQEPKEEYFDINSKVELAINLFQKDLKEITVVRDLGCGLPEALADPGMIEQVVVSLVQNAVHAVSRVEDPRVTIRTFLDQDSLFFEIVDNGCGIPDEYAEDIYLPSFTLKGSKDILGVYKTGIKGAGYGLSNAKKYIEKHKGSIRFESRINQGTKFCVSIPVIKPELSGNEKDCISRTKVQKGKKILLVEDESVISMIQHRILTQEPFCHDVKIVQTGQMAIDAFDQGVFDLISLDYRLPGNLNGLDVYRHVRKKDRNIPIVFVSGNIGFLESMKALSTKDEKMDHISKPCENIVYANTVNKWLQSQEG